MIRAQLKRVSSLLPLRVSQGIKLRPSDSRCLYVLNPLLAQTVGYLIVIVILR